MYGWTGTLLLVDLSNSRITRLPIQPYIEDYVGGRGIASRIYAETVAPGIGAFDPENRLIFMTGALVASGAQGATRMTVVSKSPGTCPEGFCFGNMGGFFGAELKKAGFDGVIFKGRAPKPVYLWIHNSEVELRDAAQLWGQGALQTGEMLQQIHGNRVRFLTTGIAGENRVRSAIIFGSHQATCIGGFGAVMGSKKLKAIAVSGSGKPTVAEPEKLKELNRYTIKISKRFTADMPPGIRDVEVVRKGGACYQCALECVRNVYRYDHRTDLEANYRCQSMVYYLPWKYHQEKEPIETLFYAPTLANDYAIDTIELEHIINWLYACYKAGILTEQETGLPLSSIGTREFLEKLLHMIAYREGFGNLLAEGLWRAGESVSKQAKSMFSPLLAPVGWREAISPRQAIVQALIYQMEPRGNQAMFHEIAQLTAGWSMNQRQPDVSPVTADVFRNISGAFWGSDAAADFSSYEGKALAARLIQNRTYLKDSLGLCDYSWPMMYSLNTADGLGDPELEAKIFRAVTGVDGEKIDLDRCGERIFNLQRLILLREGRKVPKDDSPYEHNFTQPLEVGLHGRGNMVPGPNGIAIDVTGNMLDRNKFNNMLKEYYRLRGWDEETGLIQPDTLVSLGLNNLPTTFK